MAKVDRLVKRSLETAKTGVVAGILGVCFGAVARLVIPEISEDIRQVMTDEVRQIGLYVLAASASAYRVLGPDYFKVWPGLVSDMAHMLSWAAVGATEVI